MPHRADHPTTPHGLLMRGRGMHAPPPSSLSAAYHLHHAEVAAVAAQRARFFAAGLPQTYGTLHHAMNDHAAHSVAQHSEQPLSQAPTRVSQKREIKEESPEEAAASALLLAASGESPRVPPATETESSSNPPLKKRKKHLDFLRRNTNSKDGGVVATAPATSDSSRLPCHVSPVSSSSIGTHSTSEETVSTPKYAPPASRSSSYDLKEGHPLNHEDRMKEDLDIVLIQKKFPSLLHDALSKSGTVLQWLEHGQAWRVLRWDALRREVLPKYFAQLDSSRSGGASIDSFLSLVKEWGFEEIKDGPDVGAYSHPLFVRDDPSLCLRMSNSSEEKTDTPVATKSSSSSSYESPRQSQDGSSPAHQPRSILQVPSLRSDASEKGKDHKEHSSPPASALKRNTSYPPDQAAWNGWGQHHYDPRQYRVDYARSYPEAASPVSRQTWFPFRSHEQQQQHLSQPRVRSTRGGSRAAGSVSRMPGSGELKQVSSFPVSQRGKGRRVGAHAPIRTSASHDGRVASSLHMAGAAKQEHVQPTNDAVAAKPVPRAPAT